MSEPTREFWECATCRAKPGSPMLCLGCQHNRAAIAALTAQLAEAQESREAYRKMALLREAEATALREALAQAEATLSALVVGTCPECGPVYRFDEDGCCTCCGHDVALGGQPPTESETCR